MAFHTILTSLLENLDSLHPHSDRLSLEFTSLVHSLRLEIKHLLFANKQGDDSERTLELLAETALWHDHETKPLPPLPSLTSHRQDALEDMIAKNNIDAQSAMANSTNVHKAYLKDQPPNSQGSSQSTTRKDVALSRRLSHSFSKFIGKFASSSNNESSPAETNAATRSIFSEFESSKKLPVLSIEVPERTRENVIRGELYQELIEKHSNEPPEVGNLCISGGDSTIMKLTSETADSNTFSLNRKALQTIKSTKSNSPQVYLINGLFRKSKNDKRESVTDKNTEYNKTSQWLGGSDCQDKGTIRATKRQSFCAHRNADEQRKAKLARRNSDFSLMSPKISISQTIGSKDRKDPLVRRKTADNSIRRQSAGSFDTAIYSSEMQML